MIDDCRSSGGSLIGGKWTVWDGNNRSEAQRVEDKRVDNVGWLAREIDQTCFIVSEGSQYFSKRINQSRDLEE